jgi:hypothetical protein
MLNVRFGSQRHNGTGDVLTLSGILAIALMSAGFSDSPTALERR